MTRRIVSHHKYRRTARLRAAWLTRKAKWRAGGSGVPAYEVEKAQRGPAGWYVVRL